jgi:hypothetical protein
MPARIKSFFHDNLVVSGGSPPALGTSFNTADVHVHDLLAGAVPFKVNGPFAARVEALHIRVTDIVTATKLTVKLSLDPNGDITLVPATEAALDPGITTADSGCVAIKVGIPVFQILGGSTVYLFAHVDAGSANLAQSCVTWSET